MNDILKQSRGGITDWEQKKLVLRALLPAYYDREIFEKVIEGIGNQYEREVSRLADASRKWGKHTPLREGAFFDSLVRKLGCKQGISGVFFLNASIGEFIESLPDDVRTHARAVAGLANTEGLASDSGSSKHNDTASHRVVHLHHTDEMFSMAAGVRTGVLDTRHYYSTADAAETWARLVSADAYPTYDHCKISLLELVSTAEWKKSLEETAPSIAVMLGGGGSPTKDLIIARSLLDHTSEKHTHVSMILVDINPHMLLQSEAFLRRAQQELPSQDRIEFQYRIADILKLGTRPPIFERNGAAVVFAITGGTIGNLSEHLFFHSLDQIAQAGDLLIVSADTVDDIPADQLKIQLAKKYNHAEMQRLIWPGVDAVLRELRIEESVESALQRVTVDVTPNSAAKLSDVPDSWNVTINLAAGHRNITLVRSTRYAINALANFAAQFKWNPICSVPSIRNPHFVQFAFRRK